MKYLILSLFLLSISINAYGQYEVSHLQGEIRTYDEVWELEVNNLSNENRSVIFELTLREDGKTVYRARTNLLQLQPAINQLSAVRVSPIVEYSEQSLVGEQYNLELRMLNALTAEVMHTERLRLTHAVETNLKESDGKGLDLAYSGQGQIYGQYADMQGVGSAVPANYLRAELFPDMSINGIPIGMDILLSTEQNAFKQSMNQVALRFDVQTFKRNMQKKLYAKVKALEAIGNPSELTNLKGLKDKAMAKKFPQLQEWEAKLQDPEITKGIENLKQLDNIDKILSSPEVKKAALDYAQLKTQEKLTSAESLELQRLSSFMNEIEKLRTKVEQLKGVAEKYRQYQDLGDKVAQAKKFANRDIIKDKSFLNDGLKSFDLMSKGQEILNGFQAITIGTSYPYFSKLSLSSISVNGVNVEWNPGKFYLSTIYGRSTRQTFNTNFDQPALTLPQRTLAVKLGYGSSYDTHLHFNFIDIQDSFSEFLSTSGDTRESNRIIGAEGQLSLFGNSVTVGGELQSSLFNRNKELQNSQDYSFSMLDVPLSGLYGTSNSSSSFDVAWRAFTDLNVFGNNTKFKASLEKVGPNYYSLGSPVLLNDLFRWKVEWNQSFLNNKVRAALFARRDDNNLDPLLSSVQNSTSSYGVSASVAIPSYPFVTLSYAPYAQSNNIRATDEEFDTDSRLLNVIISYPLQFSGNISSNTQFTFLNQVLNSTIPGIDYGLTMYGLNQSFIINRSSINISSTYTPNQVIADTKKEVLTFNLSGSTQFFNKLNNTFGLQYLAITGQEKRTGFFVNSTYPITSFADFELRVQRNIYSAQLDASRDFQDLIGWGGVRFRW